jgi:plastocyanin
MQTRRLFLIGFWLWSLAPAARGSEIRGQVTARGRGVAQAVVFVDGIRAGTPPASPRMMDQRRRAFIPHVMTAMVGETILFPNNDTVFHNVFSFREGKRFDLGLYPVGQVKRVHFDRPGLVKIYCNIHSDMSAFIWVLENPYSDISDARGNVRIAGVPPGRHTVRVWHEKRGERTISVEIPATGTASFQLDLGAR